MNIIGVMSGTSLDGLDLALCNFQQGSSGYKYEIMAAETVPFPHDLKNKLELASTISGLEIRELDIYFGRFIGQTINRFLEIVHHKAEMVSSHGHTVFHEPSKGFTMQIGEPSAIAAITRLPVASDFRSLDMALGGQGAPLVPIGDQLLFGEFEACLNLGGIANISYSNNNERLAFDICPCNLLLNSLAQKKGQPFDKDGNLACKGNFNSFVFDALNKWYYYNLPYPKSLDKKQIFDSLLPLFQNLSTEDALHTVSHHIAYQIAKVIGQRETLVTGGGAYNCFVIQLIEEYAKKALVIPESTLIEFKEALVFAFLGYLRVNGINNCLKSVTGASNDSCGGILTYWNTNN